MTDRALYNLVLPTDAQTLTQSQLQRQVATQGVLQGSVPAVESISLSPGERLLYGSVRGQYAPKIAAEFEELFNAPGYAAVPIYGAGGLTVEDGFYTLDNANVAPEDPRKDSLQSIEGRLTRKGTRRTHWNAVVTAPTQVDMPTDWGSDTTIEIGVPSAASKVRWIDDTGQVEQATATATRSAQYGTIEVYDAQNSSYSAPTLIYEQPYGSGRDIDCLVYDDYGRGSRLDANGRLQWQRVFISDHQYLGKPIVENGLARLTFDEGTNSLTVEQWDDANTTWSTVAMNTSNWELFDADLREVSPTSVMGAVEFRDPSTSPTSYYTLRMELHRGWTLPQWSQMPNASSNVPNGLVTKLNPVAATSIYDPEAAQTLTKRSEVHQ